MSACCLWGVAREVVGGSQAGAWSWGGSPARQRAAAGATCGSAPPSLLALQAAHYGHQILVAHEDDQFQVVEQWEAVTDVDVQTPLEVYQELVGGWCGRGRGSRAVAGGAGAGGPSEGKWRQQAGTGMNVRRLQQRALQGPRSTFARRWLGGGGECSACPAAVPS